MQRRVVGLAGPGVTYDADATVNDDAGYRAVLRVRIGDSVGERVLTADSCDALAESVAVVLALSGVKDEALATPPPPPPSPEPASPAASPTPTTPASVPAPALGQPSRRGATPPPAVAARPPSRAVVRLRAFGSLDVGTLPSSSPGGGIGATVAAGDRVWLGLAGGLSAGDRGYLADGTQGVDFTLFVTLDGTGCYALRRGPFELAPCAVVELAHLAAHGVGAVHDATAAATWIALGPGVRARWELSRALALALEVDGLFPTQGQSFDIVGGAGGGVAHAVGAFAARTSLGPEVRF